MIESRKDGNSLPGVGTIQYCGLFANTEPDTRPSDQLSERSMRSVDQNTGPFPFRAFASSVASSDGSDYITRKSEETAGVQEQLIKVHQDSEETMVPNERTPLLSGCPDANAHHSPDENANTGDCESATTGVTITTWRHESAIMARYCAPMILTFFLQNSLTLTSVLTVGKVGKIELGAISLGTMTANITGYAMYQGLATGLDTLCPQAYGSGKTSLVGLHVQRMTLFLWVITIPIALVWFNGTSILQHIVPDDKTAELAGLYLRILIAGAPGYACFESGKRFVQAQGRFDATMHVLLICAPLNVFLHWLFVWVSRSPPGLGEPPLARMI